MTIKLGLFGVLPGLFVLLVGALAYAQETRPQAAAFQVEWETRTGYWRPSVEGYVYNSSNYRVGNVRLHVEVVDTAGQRVSERNAWIYGVIDAGGRGYFVLPLPASGQTYTITVESFDLLSRQQTP